MDPQELFQANLALIDRVVGRVCTKARLFGADAEDFASEMRLALLADDCAILRRWEGRSSLATYVTVIAQRLLADSRIERIGRWHPSAEARRMGDAAVCLETLVMRDGRSLDDALPHVRAIDPALDRAALASMLARFPGRAPRPREIGLESAAGVACARDTADARAVDADRRRLSHRTGRVVREALAALSVEDRMIVRLRFAEGMSIADVSRMLRLPQRPLYRRIEAVLRKLREALRDAGIDAADVESLIGSPADDVDLGLVDGKNDRPRQSIDDRAAEKAGRQWP